MACKHKTIERVSIIIPTYNRGYCLHRTIQSVIDQTYSNWELLIVDNNSSDDTIEVIQSFNDKRIKLFKIDNKGIIAISRNYGLKMATGDYIAFLDSDDWWLPNKLAKSLKYLNLNADVVYHDMYLVNSFKSYLPFNKILKSRSIKKNAFQELLINGNAIVNSSVVLKREIIAQINGFNEDPLIVAAEDYDAWLRLARLTEAFVRIKEPLGYYWNADGVSAQRSQTIINIKRLIQIYEKDFNCQLDGDLPTWMKYSLASSYFKTKQYSKARKHAAQTITETKINNVFFKSLFIVLVCKIKGF